jgi:DNA-binding transcriptional LysR family regulator
MPSFYQTMRSMMDTSWLLDFVALADCGNFSRAAERRNMTQPAFSRRIRLLEDWVGAALLDRSTHQASLTPAGVCFLPTATDILRRLQLGAEEARHVAQSNATVLRFAATHALSLTFFPAWLRALEMRSPLGAVSLVADHMQNCEQMMLQGQVNFLLCHHHPAAPTKLRGQEFCSIRLGDDLLLPVSASLLSTKDQLLRPLFELPGAPDRPVPFLAFAETSGLGRILASRNAHQASPTWLDIVFSSHVATVLTSMARNAHGLTWAPRSLIEDDLESGNLVRAGPTEWDVPVEIRLFRSRSRLNQAAESFWSLAAE